MDEFLWQREPERNWRVDEAHAVTRARERLGLRLSPRMYEQICALALGGVPAGPVVDGRLRMMVFRNNRWVLVAYNLVTQRVLTFFPPEAAEHARRRLRLGGKCLRGHYPQSRGKHRAQVSPGTITPGRATGIDPDL